MPRSSLVALIVCLLAHLVIFGKASAAHFEVNGGLRWSGEDEPWRIELDGRIHVDGASYSSGTSTLDDGIVARRLRPSLKIRVGDSWRARLDYELADFGRGWKNVYTEYRGLDKWRIRIGNQLAPFGLEQQMSSNSFPLLERSLMQALTPVFERGVSARTQRDRWHLAAGIFSGDVGSNDARRADGQAYAARLSFAPVYTESLALHFGVSAEQRNLDQGQLRFRVRPESYVARQRLVDTRLITGADRLTTHGLEAMLVSRRCRLMGERIWTEVRFAASGPADFGGGYAAIGCLLAGERYRYRPSSGGFRSTRPNGRLGVMEVTLRRSSVDLTDAGITGGRERNWTLGLNWEFADNMRILTDFVHMDLRPNENGVAESANVWQARFQVAF